MNRRALGVDVVLYAVFVCRLYEVWRGAFRNSASSLLYLSVCTVVVWRSHTHLRNTRRGSTGRSGRKPTLFLSGAAEILQSNQVAGRLIFTFLEVIIDGVEWCSWSL